jgi:hypothetical protein
MDYNDKLNLNQNGNGGMDNDPMSKGQKQPTDSSSMSVSTPVAMGPVKKVDQGQSDRKGDVCKSSLDQIANATPLANRFKNTEGRGA